MWFAILAPAGTPAPVIGKLNAAIREVLADPELQMKFVGCGCVATASSPQELGTMIANEVPKWAELVASGRIVTQ